MQREMRVAALLREHAADATHSQNHGSSHGSEIGERDLKAHQDPSSHHIRGEGGRKIYQAHESFSRHRSYLSTIFNTYQNRSANRGMDDTRTETSKGITYQREAGRQGATTWPKQEPRIIHLNRGLMEIPHQDLEFPHAVAAEAFRPSPFDITRSTKRKNADHASDDGPHRY